MIFQDPYASPESLFTVGEIVAEGLELHKLCANAKERRERVYELLEYGGSQQGNTPTAFPHEFSGGQRQRVGIARALALNLEFIVCMSPFPLWMYPSRPRWSICWMKFQRELGLTYLFIAHDLSMVRHIADETAVMYLGTMVEYGPTGGLRPSGPPVYQGPALAVPVADPDYEKTHRRIPMEGEVPSPINPKPGCRFCGRCPWADGQCCTQTPALKDLGGGHFAACHQLNSGGIPPMNTTEMVQIALELAQLEELPLDSLLSRSPGEHYPRAGGDRHGRRRADAGLPAGL